MDITLVAEGSTKWERFIKHWGVSYLLGEEILFDTFGHPAVFWRNIKKMRVDISRIKHVVISHDDWDHIAGLAPLLKENHDLRVYVCKDSNQKFKDMIVRSGIALIEVEAPFKITENIYSSGQMRAETKRGVLYEQSLVVKTDNGITLLTGCAHPGITVIVKSVAAHFHHAPDKVIGGFHMKDNSRAENEAIAEELRSRGVKVIMPSHCTGAAAVKIFRSLFGKNCINLRTQHKVENV
jgi:7,8-dihydropterin-6-yl-methyl-4-(beta-D-ribofuranosyl)aminobenzene 5'-phosphate synthase